MQRTRKILTNTDCSKRSGSEFGLATTVPGLNLAFCKAVTAALSSMLEPVLLNILASRTAPVFGSTRISITPLPSILFSRASRGYRIFGLTTKALAVSSSAVA